MSTKRTQGPWFSSSLRTHGADPSKDGCDIGAKNGANVAIVLHQAEDRSESETRANANLIAAAPELMAALQGFMENVDEPPNRNCRCHISPPCNDCVEHSSLREAFADARAAIAKANGRAA